VVTEEAQSVQMQEVGLGMRWFWGWSGAGLSVRPAVVCLT
jgi:hypothetical protein